MRTYFTLPRPLGWGDNLEGGDLLINPTHVCIFVVRFTEEGVKKIKVIESKSSTGLVGETTYVDPAYYSNTYLENEEFFPYYFISDISPPDIAVSGVTDNGVYNKPVVLTYSVTDDLDVYPYTEILLTRDGVIAIDKEYNKYSNEKAKPIEETKQLNRDGKYELKITAEDWERNKSEKIVNFLIDTTPPTIKVYEQSKEFGREIPDGGVITSDKVEIVAEDLFGVSKIKVTAPSGRTYSENTTFNTRVLSGLYEYGEYTVFCEDKAGNKSDIFKFSGIRKEGLVGGMGDRDITPPIIMVGNTKGEFYRYPYVRVKLENDICVIRTMDEDSGIKMIIVKGINDSYYKNILVDVSSNVWHEEHLTLGSFGKYVVVVYDKNDNKGVKEFEYFPWDDTAENKGKVILSNTTGYQSLVISESTKGLRDEWYYSTGYWDGRYPAIEYVVLVDSKDVSYFLKGYCLDSYLRPPLSGMSYSQPLDVIEDESHWSYWIRKVIEYADENSTRFTNQDVLDALWYISERSYHCKNFYNELLMEVGYPIDGPRKNPAKFKVKIVEPENGEVFLVSTTIKVRVDTDISNARVSFYGGKEKMIHLGDDSEYPYEIEWFLESGGEYRLAVFCIGIVDGKEETETSDAVIIRVVDSGANLVLAKHSPLEAIHIDDDQYFCSTHTYRMPADVYEDTPVDIIIQVSTATPISSARLYYTQDATIPTLTSSYIKFTSFTATQDYIYYKATLPPQQANT